MKTFLLQKEENLFQKNWALQNFLDLVKYYFMDFAKFIIIDKFSILLSMFPLPS